MKEIFLFNEGWKFKKECEIFSAVTDDYFDMYRSNTKTGIMSGPKSIAFYDEDWKIVNLPHDWVIEEKPEKKYSASQGNRPQGVVWYRKHFRLEDKHKDKKIFLKFDGIAITSEIYLNNIKVAVSDGGYTPINIDITDFVFFGRNNTVAVRADCSCKEGWWYEGGGIYRNTYIIIKENSHFSDNGVFVTTKNNGKGVWTVDVEAETINVDDCEIVSEFMEKEYKNTSFEVENPLLWSADNPNLYEIKVKLVKDNTVYDEEIIKLGFREIKFDKDSGFYINGKNEKIKGVCLHHDHAGVGVAVDKNILKYRLGKLKEMGCNAIRTSHNPQSPEFYEVCDELGFYIMDEVRHFSSTEICLKELTEFVKRDRNHPSVIMWSLFNEEPLQCCVMGEKIIKSMIDTLHKYDTTRVVTGGMNGPLEISGVVKYTDVMGFNYLQYGYDEFHKLFPEIPIVGSETGSYLSTRDEYVTKKETSHVSCYEKVLWKNLYPWSDTPGGTWEYIMSRPYVAGGFYWTGLDYYGETGPFGWPGITSNFGAMDICGFPKDNFYWHKALWNDDYVLEIPRFWGGKDGEILNIVCYSNCETVELFVNGKSLGENKNDMYSPQIHKIPYESGSLKAVGKVDGKIVIEKEIKSYGNKRILKVAASENNITTADTVIFDVYLKDEYGNLIKNEDKNIKITLENGVLIGSANGDNTNHQKNNSDTQTLFHGCAQFIVRPKQQGKTEAFFECENMTQKCEVYVDNATMESILPSKYKAYANNHRMSDVHPAYPLTKEITNNLYTWIPTMIGVEKSLMMSGKIGYATISSTINMPENSDIKKKLIIEKITGDFDVYLNDKKVYSSQKFYSGDITINLDDFDGVINPVGVVFKLNGEDCGIAGNIYIEFNC